MRHPNESQIWHDQSSTFYHTLSSIIVNPFRASTQPSTHIPRSTHLNGPWKFHEFCQSEKEKCNRSIFRVVCHGRACLTTHMSKLFYLHYFLLYPRLNWWNRWWNYWKGLISFLLRSLKSFNHRFSLLRLIVHHRSMGFGIYRLNREIWEPSLLRVFVWFGTQILRTILMSVFLIYKWWVSEW